MKEYDLLELKDFLARYLFKDYIKEYLDLKFKINDIELEFNIFELISDMYYKENFHSDIIVQLLKNNIFLLNFLDFIDVNKEIYFENYTLKIVREESKIDIVIKTKTNCIIVENKLNWGPDMPEQLKRYYDIYNKDLIVDKVIYLSPNSNK